MGCCSAKAYSYRSQHWSPYVSADLDCPQYKVSVILQGALLQFVWLKCFVDTQCALNNGLFKLDITQTCLWLALQVGQLHAAFVYQTSVSDPPRWKSSSKFPWPKVASICCLSHARLYEYATFFCWVFSPISCKALCMCNVVLLKLCWKEDYHCRCWIRQTRMRSESTKQVSHWSSYMSVCRQRHKFL